MLRLLLLCNNAMPADPGGQCQRLLRLRLSASRADAALLNKIDTNPEAFVRTLCLPPLRPGATAGLNVVDLLQRRIAEKQAKAENQFTFGGRPSGLEAIAIRRRLTLPAIFSASRPTPRSVADAKLVRPG